MNESVRLSPSLDWLLLSTRQQPNIQPRGPCMQDDLPNDDARLLEPQAPLGGGVVVFSKQSQAAGEWETTTTWIANEQPNLRHGHFNRAKTGKCGEKSEMDASGWRKSIVKINKWIPRGTVGTSNISIFFFQNIAFISRLSHTFRGSSNELTKEILETFSIYNYRLQTAYNY